MKLSTWAWQIGLLVCLIVSLVGGPALAQDILLAGWERAPDGTVVVGDDFDPQLDNMLSCSGCWYSRTGSTGVTYSQSTTNGVTQGSGALQATIVGKGAGGEYSYPINGEQVMLDTHFDYPLVVTYSNTTNPAAGGPDPRFDAIKAAVDGNQGLYTIDFDITYDVASMRAIPWQAPEETVDPENNGQFPQRYFWIGMYANANEPDGFQYLGFDENNINPFDPQWDDNLFPVFHASFPLVDFTFQPNSETAFYSFGFLYNSVFGSLPAGQNTHGVNIYFDNFELREFDPLPEIDFNNNQVADLGDFELFMAQHLVETPGLGDFDGDGDNDFVDFQEFERLYDLVAGSGALQAALSGVPEPGTAVLLGLGIFALGLRRVRRLVGPATLAVAMGLCAQTVQAQLVESFETIGNWQANTGAAPNANPSVGLSTIGATNGTMSLLVTQAEDTIGDNDFSWNAATIPNWTQGDPAFEALANAVNIGAEHFNLLVDVTFDPGNTFDSGVNSMTVTLGLNFNGETIGTYAGETERFTTTANIPLANFDLPDVEDEGATSYSAQIGFTADALQFPFGAYIDNIRLEQISTPDLLTLQIDRSNGEALLMNLTSNPIAWDYMEIKSPAGSLDVEGWNSLDDQNIGGAGTWIEAGGSSATALVEASLLGAHTLNPGEDLPLGSLYHTGINAEDVDLEIRRAEGPSFRTYDQLVTYIGMASPGVAGDFNDDGVVNAADYVLWRNGGPLQNDPTPGVQAGDYDFWVSRFGATSGSGSGTAAVPEPTTFWLATLTVANLFLRRPRRP